MLDASDDLIYTINEETIKLSTLYDPKDHSFLNKEINKYKNLTYRFDMYNCLIILTSKDKDHDENIEIKIFVKAKEYMIFSNKKEGLFYSEEHLKKLLKKYDIASPIYQIFNKKKEIILEEIKVSVGKIVIKSRADPSELKDNYKNMIIKYDKEIVFEKEIEFENLSPNFKKYIMNNKEQKSDLIYFFSSIDRFSLLMKISTFLKSQEQIFAICGPFGIGKTFTSLFIQKQLFKEKIYSVYINLENEENMNDLKQTIIKEIFFLGLDEKGYLNLSSQILDGLFNDIWEIISKIDNYCEINKIKYLLILDQYQKNRDRNDLIYNLKTEKIFLLSSINDEDVKENLFSEKKNKKKFNYIYIANFNLQTEVKQFLSGKKEEEKKCIEMFNYNPLSIFLMENVFNWNILDFLNAQFWIILKQLDDFYNIKNITFINYLLENNLINSTDCINGKGINKEKFIKNINNISLKYITYIFEDEIAYLYYSFNYVKNVLIFERKYIMDRINIINENVEHVRGEQFENIIKHKFILDKDIMQIDGFITVNEIAKMNLVNEYEKINIKELKEKNSIFIYQLKANGEDYDMAVLYPKNEEIILIQVKYKLSMSNVNNLNYYSEKKKIKIIKDALKKLDIDAKKIYILYISSVNFNDKREAFNILKKRKINCLFYNIKLDSFSVNFENIFDDYKSLASIIYPKVEDYKIQSFEKQRRFPQMLMTALKKIQKDKKPENLEKEYNVFIDHLRSKGFKNDFVKHLGMFYKKKITSSDFPILAFNYYLLFFKADNFQNIDYKKGLFLVYEEKYQLYNYDINNGKKTKRVDLEALLKNYNFIVGIWKENDYDNNNNIIDIKEDE